MNDPVFMLILGVVLGLFVAFLIWLLGNISDAKCEAIVPEQPQSTGPEFVDRIIAYEDGEPVYELKGWDLVQSCYYHPRTGKPTFTLHPWTEAAIKALRNNVFSTVPFDDIIHYRGTRGEDPQTYRLWISTEYGQGLLREAIRLHKVERLPKNPLADPHVYRISNASIGS